MAEDSIRYDMLAQEALRGVVRTVLKQVSENGLPGDHHFYVAFDTQADGVILSKRLKDQYPEEMTIVLQYQFWDLAVSGDKFEVKLSFNNLPERLVVPFTAIRAFFDPSVQFGLQFGAPGAASTAGRTAAAVAGIVKDSREGTSLPMIAEPGIEEPQAEIIGPDEELPDRPLAEVVELDTFRKK